MWDIAYICIYYIHISCTYIKCIYIYICVWRVCVFLYVCMYVYIYIYMYVCMYVCMYLSALFLGEVSSPWPFQTPHGETAKPLPHCWPRRCQFRSVKNLPGLPWELSSSGPFIRKRTWNTRTKSLHVYIKLDLIWSKMI